MYISYQERVAEFTFVTLILGKCLLLSTDAHALLLSGKDLYEKFLCNVKIPLI